MPEYTYKDIIIDPEDPRIELGKEYYINDAPSILLDEARKDSGTVILKAVDKNKESPFVTNLGYSYYCIIRKKETSYAERQEKWIADNGIKVGDYVRVVRKADSHEDGWNNGWVDDMDNWVGKVFKVNYFNDSAGVRLVNDYSLSRSFPYFALEKVEQKYIPFDLSEEEDREALRGKWLRNKNSGSEYQVISILKRTRGSYGEWCVLLSKANIRTSSQLLDNYEFVDGTPCGKLEANQ